MISHRENFRNSLIHLPRRYCGSKFLVLTDCNVGAINVVFGLDYRVLSLQGVTSKNLSTQLLELNAAN